MPIAATAVPSPPMPNLLVRAITASTLEDDPGEELMAASNEALVAAGLRALRDPLSVFICQGVAEAFGEDWWRTGVLEVFVHDRTPTIEDVRRQRKLPVTGALEELASALDINGCLILLTKHWSRIFGRELGQDHRGWAYELIGVRNKNKHLGSDDHASDYAWRALDTMYRLCASIDETIAREISVLRSAVDLSEYGQDSGEVSVTATVVRGQWDPDTTGDGAESASTAAEATAAQELEDDLTACGPDFSGSDLRKMNFAGANLKNADFTGSDLRGVNFTEAILIGATFKGSNLAGATLQKADLTGAHFEGTRLAERFSWYGDKDEEQLYSANLAGAILEGASLNFVGCDLMRVNLTGVDLTGADFTNADMRGAFLDSANLAGVMFVATNLAGARLENTNLTAATFRKSSLSGEFSWTGRGTTKMLYSATLVGATIVNTTLDFVGCDLRRADFTGLNLDGADFSNARLGDAVLKGASMRGVSLRGADIKGTQSEGVRWA